MSHCNTRNSFSLIVSNNIIIVCIITYLLISISLAQSLAAASTLYFFKVVPVPVVYLLNQKVFIFIERELDLWKRYGQWAFYYFKHHISPYPNTWTTKAPNFAQTTNDIHFPCCVDITGRLRIENIDAYCI